LEANHPVCDGSGNDGEKYLTRQFRNGLGEIIRRHSVHVRRPFFQENHFLVRDCRRKEKKKKNSIRERRKKRNVSFLTGIESINDCREGLIGQDEKESSDSVGDTRLVAVHLQVNQTDHDSECDGIDELENLEEFVSIEVSEGTLS
jgi:hypothetical protein